MKDYVAENQRILDKWRNEYVKTNKEVWPEYFNLHEYFSLDGIMYKGEFRGEEKYFKTDEGNSYYRLFKWIRIPNGEENTLWTNAPLRLLYLTKDQNTGGNISWDVRSESFRYISEDYKPEEMWLDTNNAFYRNLVYSLYGILKTNVDRQVGYNDFTDKEALSFADEQIFARINCKKEVGGSTVSDSVLRDSINKTYNYKYLKEQILNLDADIFVCCGHQKGENLILNTVYDIYKNEFEYVPCVEGKGTGMHYNAKRNKLAIDANHLSFIKGGPEARYNETVGMYYEFLKYLKNTKSIDFSASHRQE